MDQTEDLINMAYDCLEGFEDMMSYRARHGTVSLQVLTQHSPQIAMETAKLLSPSIDNKDVIEIGAGVGFLAIEMAKRAKSVFAIEVDPAWSWIFTKSLYAHKPRNLTWIFGDARQLIGKIRGDVAIVITRSGAEDLRDLAGFFAPKVIMPFQGIEQDF